MYRFMGKSKEIMNTEKSKPVTDTTCKEKEECKLVLFNDHMNTFSFVIACLVEICHHDYMQAETCTHIAHSNGKCVIKHGSYEDLRPMYDLLTQKQLTVVLL